MQFKVNRNQNKPLLATCEGWPASNNLCASFLFFLLYTQTEKPTPASTPNTTPTINADSTGGDGPAGPGDPLGYDGGVRVPFEFVGGGAWEAVWLVVSGGGGGVRLDTGGGGVELKGTGEPPGDGDDIVPNVSGEWYFVVRERGRGGKAA